MEALHNSASFVESDEEDYEIYFLQPASSPYNIKEKLEKANRDLLEDNPDINSRLLKVQFKEDLVDYEPDLTDDDVQSIESYNEAIDYNLIDQHSQDESFLYIMQTKLELNIFPPNVDLHENYNYDPDDEGEEDEEEEEDDHRGIAQSNEEIAEEIPEENQEIQEEFQEGECEEEGIVEEIISDDIQNGSEEDSTDSNVEDEVEGTDYGEFKVETMRKQSSNSNSPSANATNKSNSPMLNKKETVHIDCKTHCIEKLEFELSINKLQISEKPICPTLKLQKRKCCEKNPIKKEQKLPCYSGLRSEYGLSLAQLEKRDRKKELTKLREEKRKHLMEEYKQRKIQQNEEIFCQWLRNVERRRQEQAKKREYNNKKYLSPKILNFPSKSPDKFRERPKTSNNLLPSHNVKRKKRPRTSPACVFIEVPHDVLNRGIQVRDLLVAKSSGRVKVSPKKLHILTVA